METQLSLLEKLQHGGDVSWRELDRIYRPMIFNWLRQFDVREVDAEDIAQEVLLCVSRKIEGFDHNGRVGAFRKWLKAITVNTSRDYLRGNKRNTAQANSAFQMMLATLEDPNHDLSRQFDLEHDRHVLRALLEDLKDQFKPTSLESFRLHVIQGVDVRETSERVGLSVPAVYMAKARIMHHLRQKATNWIEEMEFAR